MGRPAGTLYGFAPGTFPGTFDAYQSGSTQSTDRGARHRRSGLEGRRPFRVEHQVVWPDGTIRWIQGSGRVTIGPDGE